MESHLAFSLMSNKKSLTRRILRWTFGAILVFIVFGFVGRWVGLFGGERTTEVETSKAEIRRITQVVTASGRVQPEIEVKISPDVSGEIIELRVREGDPVRQGDLLVRIRPDFYAAQVEQAQAGVLQARANMAQRRANMLNFEIALRRQKELYERSAVSESALETAQTQYEIEKAAHEAAEYAVQSAQARLRETEEQLSKTSIYSPMTGTVSQLNVEPGERVVGTSQFAGTEMLRIARLDRMELEVDVNENDVVNITLGDSASVEIDAYSDRTFTGVVTEIANSARIANPGSQEQVTNFPVKIRLGDSRAGRGGSLPPSGDLVSEEVPIRPLAPAVLRPGMSGNVDVFTHTVDEAVAVPIQAVTVRDYSRLEATEGETGDGTESTERRPEDNGGKREDLRKVVFTVVDGKARMVQVETGITDATHVEVTMGLTAGDVVVTGPYRLVSRELEQDMEVTTAPEAGGNRPATASSR